MILKYQTNNIRKIGGLFFLGLILILCNLKSNAGDFEIWTFAGIKKNWNNAAISVDNANFFTSDINWFLNHTQISLDFKSKRAISFGIGYKQEYVKFPERTRAEYRPMLHLYYSKNWGNIYFRDRSRWEFRFMDGELINRYRNQLQFSYKKFKSVIPYLSTEFSFYFNKLDYTRQRTLLGAQIPVNRLNFDLFLGHQVNEDAPHEWEHKIMLGTAIRYNL